ncbi:replicase polyprotein 1a [Plakobranchus ocellatus]|uniref:Replicase polyprotein 1a n=1 Tax=Plakobranchus ocellatus TaxID=259542 RepID=A0AAV4BZU3_9GAST|nr:replicase polyprotein 1a [Plakobranchus ocellatus]
MWLPNHFLPIDPESSDDNAADDEEKQTEDCVCGGCDDDDVLNNDGNDDYVDNDNNKIDNYTGYDGEEESGKVTSSPVVLYDGDDTETDDETRDSDDLIGMCFEGKELS